MVNTSNTWEWFLMKRYFISECVHFQYSNDCILNLYIYMIFLIKFVKEICFCSRKYLTFIFSYWRLSKREFSKFLSYLSEYSWRLKYYRWTIYVYQINSKADEISPSQINSKVPISQKVFFVQDIFPRTIRRLLRFTLHVTVYRSLFFFFFLFSFFSKLAKWVGRRQTGPSCRAPENIRGG